jgi:CDP-glucose 4,6-dehydratase
MEGAAWPALKGRSVLVTGHTGFMGSWLTLWLHSLGAQVTGYALNPSTQPDHFHTARIEELLVDDVRGDIRDAETLARVVERCAPEVIFHLAAQPVVREGLRQPRETFDVNVIGTASLCDAVRSRRHPCVVIVASSDKCYRNDGTDRIFEERDPLGGNDPYSASKAGTELVVAAYRASYFPPERAAEHGVRMASVRAGNVIGGGDWAADRIVPDAIRALAAGTDLIVRHPASLRPWQHVLEPLSGYLSLAARLLSTDAAPDLDDAWNFGPLESPPSTVADLASALIAQWGSGRWVSGHDPAGDTEAVSLRISIDKALTQLDWSPRWNFHQAVIRAVEWYRAFYQVQPDSMRDHSLRDISAYQHSSAIVRSALP